MWGVYPEVLRAHAQKSMPSIPLFRKGLLSQKHAVCVLRVLKASEASVQQFCQERITNFITGQFVLRHARVWLTHKEGEKGWLRQLGSVKKETWGSICSQTSGWAVGWHKRACGTYVCFTQAHNKRAPAHKYASHSPASTRYCLSRDVAPPCPWTGKIAQIAKIIVARLVLWSSSHACDLHNFIHPVFDQLSTFSSLC